MADTARGASTPVNFRLPDWVVSFLATRAEALHTTKTQVLIEAVACLRDRDLQTLMAEGYRDRGDELLELSESALPAAAETLPER